MSRKLSDEQKHLNKLINERARLAMQESLLGTKFDLVKSRMRELDSEIRDADKRLKHDDNSGFPVLNAMEKQFCQDRDHLSAIRSVKDRLNLTITEAKEAVDHYRRANNLIPGA